MNCGSPLITTNHRVLRLHIYGVEREMIDVIRIQKERLAFVVAETTNETRIWEY